MRGTSVRLRGSAGWRVARPTWRYLRCVGSASPTSSRTTAAARSGVASYPPGGCRVGACAVIALAVARCGRRARVAAGGRHVARRVAGPRGVRASGVRSAVQGAAETEVTVAGQLALVIETETVVPAAVWETLPPEHQLQVALRLARLLAR